MILMLIIPNVKKKQSRLYPTCCYITSVKTEANTNPSQPLEPGLLNKLSMLERENIHPLKKYTWTLQEVPNGW